jgi:hypothetical protein
MGGSGQSQLGPAKRCGTAIFGKPSASCFGAVVGPRKPSSASGRSWHDNRGCRRLRADWILVSLVSVGIFGGGSESRQLDPFGEIQLSLYSFGKLSDRRICLVDRSSLLSRVMEENGLGPAGKQVIANNGHAIMLLA